MRKRLLILLAAAVVLLAGCGCGKDGKSDKDTKSTTKATTTAQTTTKKEETTKAEENKTEETTQTTQQENVAPAEATTTQPAAPAYTYTDLDKTMYAKSSVNVRDLPGAEGNKLGGLSKVQEVHVTGQCNESKWYRIDFNGSIAYVSNNYLVDEKPAEEAAQAPVQAAQAAPAQSGETGEESCPYPLYTIMYDNQGYPYYYGKWGGSANMDADNYAKTQACDAQVSQYLGEHYQVWNEDHTSSSCSSMIGWKSIGRYQGMQVVVRYVGVLNDVRLAEPEDRGIPTAGNGIWKQ